MTSDLSDRDRAIVAARACKFGYRRIGWMFGLSHTQVRRILDRLAHIDASNTFRAQNFPTAKSPARKPHFRAQPRSAPCAIHWRASAP